MKKNLVMFFIVTIALVIFIYNLTLIVNEDMATLKIFWAASAAVIFLVTCIILLLTRDSFARVMGVVALIMSLLFGVITVNLIGWDKVLPPSPPTALPTLIPTPTLQPTPAPPQPTSLPNAFPLPPITPTTLIEGILLLFLGFLLGLITGSRRKK